MYKIEQIELLIKYKEEKLSKLKGLNDQTKEADIKVIESEIKALKSYRARYEIARIIGHTDEEFYKNNNYVGIEKEDFSKMNLTPDQLNQINNLINDIPENDVDLFRRRLQIAKMLKEDNNELLKLENYQDIEKKDHTNIKYGLSDEEIQKIDRIKEEINQLKQNNNIVYFNFNNLTINTINELIKEFNDSTIDQYKHKNEEDLKTLFELINIAYKKLEIKNINNYDFGSDLVNKYPTSKIQLNTNCIIDLITLLNREKNIEEDKYNSYLNLIVNNIDRIQEDNKTDELNNILNSIEKTNYVLRNDLLERTNLEELKLQDNEMITLFKYLDSNYDNLEDKTKEKDTKFLLSKLNNSLGDLNKVDEVNKLLLTVNNKEFKEVLRKNLQSNSRAMFNDRHVSTYSNVVNDRIKKLESRKKYYTNKKTGIDAIDIIYVRKIKSIEKEIDRLNSLNVEYNNIALKGLDSSYNNKNEKITNIEKEIEELKKVKEELKSSFQQQRVEKKIKKLNLKMNKLKRKQVKIVNMQKKIMAPKLWVNSKRGAINRYYESKTETFNDYSSDYSKLAEMERQKNGMFSDIKAMFYEHKRNKYARKSEFNRKIYNLLAKPGNKITVDGSNTRSMPKDTLQQLRGASVQQTAAQTI